VNVYGYPLDACSYATQNCGRSDFSSWSCSYDSSRSPQYEVSCTEASSSTGDGGSTAVDDKGAVGGGGGACAELTMGITDHCCNDDSGDSLYYACTVGTSCGKGRCISAGSFLCIDAESGGADYVCSAGHSCGRGVCVPAGSQLCGTSGTTYCSAGHACCGTTAETKDTDMTCEVDCPIERVSSIVVPAQPYMYPGGGGDSTPIPIIAGTAGGAAVLALVLGFIAWRCKNSRAKQQPVISALPRQWVQMQEGPSAVTITDNAAGGMQMPGTDFTAPVIYAPPGGANGSGMAAAQFHVAFSEQQLGMTLADAPDGEGVAVVALGLGPAEMSGQVAVGDKVVGIDATPTRGLGHVAVNGMLAGAPRPVTVHFERKVQAAPQQPPTAPAAPPQPVPVAVPCQPAQFCAGCGAQLNAGAAFCPGCGQAKA
jgi:hypothetical protein